MRLLQGMILAAIVLDAALMISSSVVPTTTAAQTIGMSAESETSMAPTTVLTASR